jgi:two-component system, sensor histidine kinase YcbA
MTLVTAFLRRARGRLADYLLKPLNKKAILVVTVTVIVTELFVATAIGPFRFSIGTVIFVYAILSFHQLLIIPTALLVVISSFLLRFGLDFIFSFPQELSSFMLAHQYSGLVYFFLLSVLLSLVNIRKFSRRISLLMVSYLWFAVSLSNLAEALIRVPYQALFNADNFIILFMMSAIQVFLIISLLNISYFQRTLVLDEEQKASYERMLIVASDLYDEQFYMQKSMENIEKIMAKSYILHKRLKEMKMADPLPENSALEIAEEVHEVKKDTMRVLAGLSEVIKIRREKPFMSLTEIIDLVIKTNSSYAQSLDKEIRFTVKIEKDLAVKQIYPLLSILNNLVSNAVEAVSGEGFIRLQVRSRASVLRITVCDNGEPIRADNQALIFEAGFTTKFTVEGVPSTGIGLAYVRGLVEKFRGRVIFRQSDQEKCFIILVPVRSVTEDK